MSDAPTPGKKALPGAVAIFVVLAAVLGWLLVKAYDPKPEEIARFLTYELRGDQGVVFAADGAAIEPAPLPAGIEDAECRKTSKRTDFDEWACFYTYTGADGETYKTVLTATLIGSIFREDRFNMRDVGMYNIGVWAEQDQRAMFANFDRPLP